MSSIDILEQKIENAQTAFSNVKTEIARHFIGQEQVVNQCLSAILAGGHVLLVGVPGLGKTRLVDTLGRVLGLSTNRVQFTPDLMPNDILGSEILDVSSDQTRSFRFVEGPIFCQMLMADEINRASPRTQSALLQAMQEHEVSIAGKTRALGKPFHVLATQNPIEQEGTYPLPEAQLDRFLLQVYLDYPKFTTERDIVLNTIGIEQEPPKQMLCEQELVNAQNMLRHIPVGEQLLNFVLELVRAFRPSDETSLKIVRDFVHWGPGPRAAQALMMAARAHAVLDGRTIPTMGDVISLAKPVLAHRIELNYTARTSGLTKDTLINDVITKINGAEDAA